MNNLRTLCRTCGSTINEEIGIKLFEELHYPLVTLIADITDMWIENDITLPEFICKDCKSILDRIVEFRASCLSTHKKLLAARKKDIDKNNAKSNADNENIDNILDINNILLADDNADQLTANITLMCDNLMNPKREEKSLGIKNAKSCVRTEKPHRTNLPKPRQNRTKTWICELCGGVFKCSTYLKLHLLRHTGKKEFECDICKGKYYTQNEMLRHKILHTNAKPYACRYCDKTFRGTSSKAVHERTHTNERPFPCRFCEKSFRSTSVRKMHERMHVNNRKFHCELCDKWFLRSSHLSLHQRTKLHKSKAAS